LGGYRFHPETLEARVDETYSNKDALSSSPSYARLSSSLASMRTLVKRNPSRDTYGEEEDDGSYKPDSYSSSSSASLSPSQASSQPSYRVSASQSAYQSQPASYSPANYSPYTSASAASSSGSYAPSSYAPAQASPSRRKVCF